MFYFQIMIKIKYQTSLLLRCLKIRCSNKFFFLFSGKTNFWFIGLFLGNLNCLQNKMFLSQPLRTAYRTIDSKTIWNIERSHLQSKMVYEDFSSPLLILDFACEQFYRIYFSDMYFFCFVERQVWTTYVTLKWSKLA